MRNDDEEDLVRRSAASHFSRGEAIWSSLDRWNVRKVAQIDRFCRLHVPTIWRPGFRTLNAGAGSHSYDWMPPDVVAFDRFASQLAGLKNAIVGDIEQLPFGDEEFDLVICVGSVINYASALEALFELSRVLKRSGALILHFETSDSLEHIGTRRWRAPVARAQTVNNGRPDTIWIYSQAFVRRTLERFGIRVERKARFHIASAALLRVGLSQQSAARAQVLDPLLFPLRAFADDAIIVGRKGAEPVGETGI